MIQRYYFILTVIFCVFASHVAAAKQTKLNACANLSKEKNELPACDQGQELCGYDLSGGRFALIFGTNKYTSDTVSDLKKAEDDAEAMQATLEKIGFATRCLLNANKAQAEGTHGFDFAQKVAAKIATFGQRARLIIYFAGHGYTRKSDENDAFMAFSDVTRDDPDKGSLDLKNQLADLLLAADDRINPFFLVDACRELKAPKENILSLESMPFSKPEKAHPGFFIAFSAAQNKRARDDEHRFMSFMHSAHKGQRLNKLELIGWSIKDACNAARQETIDFFEADPLFGVRCLDATFGSAKQSFRTDINPRCRGRFAIVWDEINESDTEPPNSMFKRFLDGPPGGPARDTLCEAWNLARENLSTTPLHTGQHSAPGTCIKALKHRFGEYFKDCPIAAMQVASLKGSLANTANMRKEALVRSLVRVPIATLGGSPAPIAAAKGLIAPVGWQDRIVARAGATIRKQASEQAELVARLDTPTFLTSTCHQRPCLSGWLSVKPHGRPGFIRMSDIAVEPPTRTITVRFKGNVVDKASLKRLKELSRGIRGQDVRLRLSASHAASDLIDASGRTPRDRAFLRVSRTDAALRRSGFYHGRKSSQVRRIEFVQRAKPGPPTVQVELYLR